MQICVSKDPRMFCPAVADDSELLHADHWCYSLLSRSRHLTIHHTQVAVSAMIRNATRIAHRSRLNHRGEN